MIIVLERTAALPIGLEDVKFHARIDSDEEDARLTRYLRAATEYVETRTGLVATPTRVREHFDTWYPNPRPWRGPVLGRSPVRSLVSVNYSDEDGAAQVVDAANYAFDRTPEGAVISLSTSFSLPALVSDRLGGVWVEYWAGFDLAGDSPADPDYALPFQFEQAVLLLTSHWYEIRSPVVLGISVSEIPTSAEALMDQIRVFR